MKTVVIIGAGPTGLFASSLLLNRGYTVKLYDQKSKAGRKLLLAGKSGLNVTNTKNPETFSAAYGDNQKQMSLALTNFTPSDLRLWMKQLGIETFEGSTGLVFPVSHSADSLLSLWLESLVSNKQFNFHPDHRLINIENRTLFLENKNNIISITPPLIIMGMGGASYPSTGSDGKWRNLLNKVNIETISFKPINCGFECRWSPLFKKKINYSALKNIKLTMDNQSIRGDATITSYGFEGGPFYRLSREIRKSIEQNGRAITFMDLTPDLSLADVTKKTNHHRGKDSISNHLRKRLKLSGTKINLLKEVTEKNIFDNYDLLAQAIKNLPIILLSPRPIAEAISSSGGISFKELDNYFMIKKYPGWFTAGEMVDWDAPTGGYLLQGCFSTAYMAVEGIKNFTDRCNFN
ncbi:MAG: TIGR03862 family flavoprotein [Spirochaetota bacterium]|nr:TIGR03862 family flavoprotein [Spirochaetota bacterium]